MTWEGVAFGAVDSGLTRRTFHAQQPGPEAGAPLARLVPDQW